ncbi:MAG: hypothetical protein VX633_14845, partial [Verrucomicrobiota bacterium]|nr:hypothetical protein [Verrucomicrobiota bacterium]
MRWWVTRRARCSRVLILVALMGSSLGGTAHGRSWRECLSAEIDWYGTAEAVRIADNVLFYQARIGGWYKNDNSVHPSGHAATENLTEVERRAHREALRQREFP